jgi:hypothetical protein
LADRNDAALSEVALQDCRRPLAREDGLVDGKLRSDLAPSTSTAGSAKIPSSISANLSLHAWLRALYCMAVSIFAGLFSYVIWYHLPWVRNAQFLTVALITSWWWPLVPLQLFIFLIFRTEDVIPRDRKSFAIMTVIQAVTMVHGLATVVLFGVYETYQMALGPLDTAYFVIFSVLVPIHILLLLRLNRRFYRLRFSSLHRGTESAPDIEISQGAERAFGSRWTAVPRPFWIRSLVAGSNPKFSSWRFLLSVVSIGSILTLPVHMALRSILSYLGMSTVGTSAPIYAGAFLSQGLIAYTVSFLMVFQCSATSTAHAILHSFSGLLLLPALFVLCYLPGAILWIVPDSFTWLGVLCVREL